jgi:integrase
MTASASTTSVTYASIGLAGGTHPKVMAERLGHATVGITPDTYSHVAPALAEQAADDLAALILGPPETH